MKNNMPSTNKRVREGKEKVYKEKAFVVFGQLGITFANKNFINLEKEVRRLKKIGWSSSIIPCVITYKVKK